MEQISFATLAESVKKRKTKRERLLDKMETVVPWPALMALIEGGQWTPAERVREDVAHLLHAEVVCPL